MGYQGMALLTHLRSAWQPINVTWLSLNFKSPQKRAIAYAVYSKTHQLTKPQLGMLIMNSGMLQPRRYLWKPGLQRRKKPI